MGTLRNAYVTGVEVTVENIGRLRRGIREENRAIADDMAARLFHISTGIVPYLSGRVFNSAFNTDLTYDPNKPERAVGYDSGIPYIWQLHETPNRVHPVRGPRSEPKQDHFLSEPRNALEAVFMAVATSRLKGRVSRMRSLSIAEKVEAMRAVDAGV